MLPFLLGMLGAGIVLNKLQEWKYRPVLPELYDQDLEDLYWSCSVKAGQVADFEDTDEFEVLVEETITDRPPLWSTYYEPPFIELSGRRFHIGDVSDILRLGMYVEQAFNENEWEGVPLDEDGLKLMYVDIFVVCGWDYDEAWTLVNSGFTPFRTGGQ